MDIVRHGGESHVVRPDRVYRTGVLAPIVGYQPGADVQAVAAAFTLGPPSGTVLSGYGLGNVGLITQLKLKIQSWIATAKAKKMMQVADAAGSAGVAPAPQAPGPSTQAAAQVLAPDQAGRAMAVWNRVNPMPGPMDINSAARVMAWRRQNSLYRAG